MKKEVSVPFKKDFMKVTLVATHQITLFEPVFLRHCGGVLVLYGALRQRGINCEVVDLHEFHNLYDMNFNEVFDSIADKIVASRPQILGFSTMSGNLPFALELSERIKRREPGIIIILGGTGVSFTANEIMVSFPHVDAIIRGEADVAFPDFVDSLVLKDSNPGIKGLVYRNGTNINDFGWAEPLKDVNDLPIPGYELDRAVVDEKDKPGYPYLQTVEVGRGCPFNCTFCVTSEFFKRKFRLKSVNRILKEVRYIREKIRDKPMMLLHDLLTLNHSYIEQLCEELKRQVPGLVWKCYTRLDTLNESILKKMREAGCNELFIGIEVGNDRMQRLINKNLDLTCFDEIMNVLKRLDYIVRMAFIVGFPFEETFDIISIFSLVMRARLILGDKVNCILGTLEPEKMTPIYEAWNHTLALDEYGGFPSIILPVSWNKLKQMVKDNPHIFFPYYHYHVSSLQRINTIRYVLLGNAVNTIMKNSLKLAYMARGDYIFEELIKNSDRIEMPTVQSLQKGNYLTAMDSIRRLVYELLQDDPALACKFDALARYELAIMEMSEKTSGMDMKVIQVNYDPIKLMTVLESDTAISGGNENRDLLYCMLIWDEEEQRIKCTTIPKTLAGSFLNRRLKLP